MTRNYRPSQRAFDNGMLRAASSVPRSGCDAQDDAREVVKTENGNVDLAAIATFVHDPTVMATFAGILQYLLNRIHFAQAESSPSASWCLTKRA